MAVTTMNNVVNPEVMGTMIEAKIDALAKITPYAKVDTTLQGVAGDTKTVPSWDYIGDAEDIAEGEEVGLTSMSASTSTFTIKKAMKSVGISQEAVNSGLGNPIGQAETQLAKSIVGKVDNDLIDAATGCKNTVGGSAKIGYEPIVEAVGSFGDEEETEKVMFIHPSQETTLRKDASFISADKYQAGVAVTGAIGMIAGCNIKKSKKVKSDAYYATTTSSTSGALKIVSDDTKKADVKATEIRLADVLKVNRASFGVSTLPDESALTVDSYVKFTAATMYFNPIIKIEPDSAETEFTEEELPALTIFLKKDTQVDAEFKPRKQQHEITAAKYYGVALTNAGKVVVLKSKA